MDSLMAKRPADAIENLVGDRLVCNGSRQRHRTDHGSEQGDSIPSRLSRFASFGKRREQRLKRIRGGGFGFLASVSQLASEGGEGAKGRR